ncbi:unnamed protein product [Rhizophagus irregularis]|uniref:Uncharacterized protein n=1 Tax=Rhizophagus irregularis TaxID=588596 RepID=A0A915ZP09_9GLOM|nr:unnamed protein product [Rhizophagus irregularis]CAB5382504.1 unnamed protein product [Rhizophagus irregularis]
MRKRYIHSIPLKHRVRNRFSHKIPSSLLHNSSKHNEASDINFQYDNSDNKDENNYGNNDENYERSDDENYEDDDNENYESNNDDDDENYESNNDEGDDENYESNNDEGDNENYDDDDDENYEDNVESYDNECIVDEALNQNELPNNNGNFWPYFETIILENNIEKLKIQRVLTFDELPESFHTTIRQQQSRDGALWLLDRDEYNAIILLEPQAIIQKITISIIRLQIPI